MIAIFKGFVSSFKLKVLSPRKQKKDNSLLYFLGVYSVWLVRGLGHQIYSLASSFIISRPRLNCFSFNFFKIKTGFAINLVLAPLSSQKHILNSFRVSHYFCAEGGTRTHKLSHAILSRTCIPFHHFGNLFTYFSILEYFFHVILKI